MTNAEILRGEIVLHGLNICESEVNTYAGWKRNGYQVKKGEKAVFSTKIWKPCRVKKENTENESSENETNLILVSASFFTIKQVEKIMA